MYFHFILFSLALAVAPSVSSKDDCKKWHPHELGCCKFFEEMRDSESASVAKECAKEHPRPEPPAEPNCDFDECMCKKLGYCDDKGTMDKEALHKQLESEFKDKKIEKALPAIEKDCINADNWSEYGHDGDCDLRRMTHCVNAQMMMTCTEWDDKPHCDDVKKDAEECKA